MAFCHFAAHEKAKVFHVPQPPHRAADRLSVAKAIHGLLPLRGT
jgi:hypothetical protein